MNIIKFLIVLIIGLGAGVFLGFSFAPTEFLKWNSQFRASIIAHEIETLKRGDVQRVVDSKELELNGELELHGRYLENNFSWLLPSIHKIRFDKQHIQYAVNYRLNNPYVYEKWSNPKIDQSIVEAVNLGFDRQQESVNKVLKHYNTE